MSSMLYSKYSTVVKKYRTVILIMICVFDDSCLPIWIFITPFMGLQRNSQEQYSKTSWFVF